MSLNSNIPPAKECEILYHNLSPRGKHTQSKSQLQGSKSLFRSSVSHSIIKISGNSNPHIKKSGVRANNQNLMIEKQPENKLTPSCQLRPLQHLLQSKNLRKSCNSYSKSSLSHQGRVTRIAYSSNNAIHVDPQFLALMQEYSDRDVVFIGIYGKNQAGKSMLIDQILHLAGIGDVKTEIMRNNQDQRETSPKGSRRGRKRISLNTWSTPFSKNPNTRIFLLDLQHFFFSEILSIDQEMILDTFLLLSSVIIVLPQHNDHEAKVLKQTEAHFRNRMRNLLANGSPTRSSYGYWPKELYCAYRAIMNPDNRVAEDLKQVFNGFNFVLLPDAFKEGVQGEGRFLLGSSISKTYTESRQVVNKEYLRNIVLMFKDIHLKIQTKQYLKLKYTGRVVIGLLTNIAHFLNLSQNSIININEVFTQVTKQLYLSAYNFQLIRYNQKLEHHLSQQNPKPLELLLQIFKQCSQTILQDFSLMTVTPELQTRYWQKLLTHIDEKQKIILMINEKKSKKRLSQILKDQRRGILTVQDVKYSIWDMKSKGKECEQGRTEIVGQELKQMVQQFIQKDVIRQQRDEKQKIESMTDRKQHLERQLRMAIALNENKAKEELQMQKQITSQRQNLVRKIETLKRQILQIRNKRDQQNGAKFILSDQYDNRNNDPQFIVNKDMNVRETGHFPGGEASLIGKHRSYMNELKRQLQSNERIRENLLKQSNKFEEDQDEDLIYQLKKQIQITKQKQSEVQDRIDQRVHNSQINLPTSNIKSRNSAQNKNKASIMK